MGIKLEETVPTMMGIKQITWIINRDHFVPDTPEEKAATANTIHISFILWKVIKEYTWNQTVGARRKTWT